MRLFKEGKKIKNKNIVLFYSINSELTSGVKVGIKIDNKILKKACDRNKLKRLIQEAYRYYKPQLKYPSLCLLFLITLKVAKPQFDKDLLNFKDIKYKIYSLLKEAKLIQKEDVQVVKMER